ncbi:hypothetical protein Pcinc_019265 [Petrolisthes cinctipes]|uniref:BHLH domain-containing protein n=1 Tax=Petrolisthes cinctipes TaxID=88211 RepID=A0AAE1FKN3_PETCI|nr:hypothetical protein Pcinc_019265 [Petrolisthes cinctipes]
MLSAGARKDEVDVVSCPEQNEASVGGNLPSAFLPTGTTTTVIPTKTTHISTSTNINTTTNNKCSADVKRQLQLAIQEAMRNRQNRGTCNEGGEEVTNTTGLTNNNTTTTTTTTTTTGRLVSVKIKTQGKPAAYTKRMRDQHSEQVIRSSKHRRRGRGGESDEGRRSVHNSLERQRRIDLRNAFEHLRLLVPETKILEKAPKVQILKKAADHCRLLRLDEERLQREKETLVRRVEELKRRKTVSS